MNEDKQLETFKHSDLITQYICRLDDIKQGKSDEDLLVVYNEALSICKTQEEIDGFTAMFNGLEL